MDRAMALRQVVQTRDHSSQVKWIKSYSLPWYLTQFSTNPALNNSVKAFIPTLALTRNSVNAPI